MGRFLDYKMVDSKTVVSQIQELQEILHNIHVDGIMLSKTFQVIAIIEKFPPTWNGEKVYIRNFATSEIKRQGEVVLKMTFGNELTQTNVLYVP